MNLFQLFKASLMEPRKQAAVRIMSIGKILRYVFVLVLLMTIVSFAELAVGLGNTGNDTEGLLEFVEDIKWLLYPFAFIFLFVSTTLYHFVKISLFALVGLVFIQMKKRKGEYRHLWRTTALAVTIPTLLSFAFSFFDVPMWATFALGLLTIIYLHFATNYYPKQPPAKKKPA
ncbi:DUF1189 family protein [Planococcus sp. N064]|uniref:DUF1189 family protein n=1 Tax=Planococcus liqunii TaxID=3058394 RepID=A0ABT8MPM7_9BACL|nr:DUF1189 family protein [Planococcus sp. N064]MDN7226852.1 DUF1189 family protein [Planococcus sp. N064]